MYGQDYLNQISAQNRPVKATKPGILNSKFFMIGMIGIVALIIIIIIGSILGGNKSDEKNLSFALKLHLDNTTEIISSYQSSVKSSNLRSYSASLTSVLSNTNRELTDYITEVYDYKEKSIPEKIVEEATILKDALDTDLFEAKINGNLDRIYAHKMVYEISLLMSEEARLISMTKNSGYKNALTESYESLNTLYDSFNKFSETK